jgi:hypothetical protein
VYLERSSTSTRERVGIYPPGHDGWADDPDAGAGAVCGYYLGERREHLGEIQMLARLDTQEADQVLMKK